MNPDRPSSPSSQFDELLKPGKIGDPNRYTWDDDVPVPVHLHVTCDRCGSDLTGQGQRSCPRCGRPFFFPIPAELGLRCPECDYELTGLTSRRCPECGTHFNPRDLALAPKRASGSALLSRWSLEEWITWPVAGVFLALGAMSVVTGIFPIAGRSRLIGGMLLVTCLLGALFVVVHDYFRATVRARSVFVIGFFWTVMGLLAVWNW